MESTETPTAACFIVTDASAGAIATGLIAESSKWVCSGWALLLRAVRSTEADIACAAPDLHRIPWEIVDASSSLCKIFHGHALPAIVAILQITVSAEHEHTRTGLTLKQRSRWQAIPSNGGQHMHSLQIGQHITTQASKARAYPVSRSHSPLLEHSVQGCMSLSPISFSDVQANPLQHVSKPGIQKGEGRLLGTCAQRAIIPCPDIFIV